MATLFGLASGLHVLWQVSASIGLHNQFDQINSEGIGEPLKKVDAGTDSFILDATDRGSVDLSIDGQILLRDLSKRAQSSKIPSDTIAAFHRPQASNLSPRKPSDIFDIYRLTVVLVFGVNAKGQKCGSPS